MMYQEFEELRDSDALNEIERSDYMMFFRREGTTEDLQSSLRNLSDCLSKHYGSQVIILIDEYDNPVNGAETEEDRRKIIDFLRTFMSSALKGNSSLKFGIVTGVMQISKESIFSGLNNLDVNNIFSRWSNEMFGFTPGEVKQLCSDYGRPEMYKEAKEWYDGYVFGDSEIYNPWSVLKYIQSEFVPDIYWAGTSDNSIIEDLLRIADARTFEILRNLSTGGSVSMMIDPRVTFQELSSKSSTIFSIMVMSGYLRAVPEGDGYHSVSIPNKEIYGEYLKIVTDHLDTTGASISDLFKVLVSGDASLVSSAIEDLLMTDLSFRILDDEASYQAYLVGLFFHLHHLFDIRPERETGKGYCDILMKSRRSDVPSIVIEIKRHRKDDPDLDRLAHDAVLQIHDRKYYNGLSGRVLLYGMAFESKDAKIVSEEISL